MKNIIGYDIDDLLNFAGLQRRTTFLGSVLPAVGLVAIGAAFGAAVGLSFAPSSGRRLRQDMSDRLEQLRERMKTEAARQIQQIKQEKQALNASVQHGTSAHS
jgi:sensor domain CHASE-containing protein